MPITERFTRNSEIDTPPEASFSPQEKPEHLVFYESLHYGELRKAGCVTYPVVALPGNPLNEFERTGSNELAEAHTIMSMSDFELASTPAHELTSKISEAEAKSVIRGVAGHKLTYIVTELTRQLRSGQYPSTVTVLQQNIDQEERVVIDAIASRVLSQYRTVFVQDVPLIATEIWMSLRDEYVFVKKIPNSTKKPLIEGTQYSSDWVRDYWNSDEQKDFEGVVSQLHEQKIRQFLDHQPLGSEALSLPLESNPLFKTETEKPLVTHAELGAFRIQFRGQADYVLTNTQDDYHIGIDLKFGNPDLLYSLPNRLQALAYSHALRERQFSKKKYSQVTPSDVMFLYEVINTKPGAEGIYYKDATVYPNEYPALMNSLYQTCLYWWLKHTDFTRLKKEKKNAIVMPHFPSPDELSRAMQRSMVF